MMNPINRRDFLKLGLATLGGLAAAPYTSKMVEFDDRNLVRISTTSVSVHVKPDDITRITGQLYRDEVIPIYDEVDSGTPGYNPIWYRVWGGFIHRARIQKVKNRLNEPKTVFVKDKDLDRVRPILAEVTVPYTQTMVKKSKGWEALYRLYYGTVHWVVGIEEGPDGGLWYQVLDELHDSIYDAPAEHLRIIPPEEYAPISPNVAAGDKRIEVNLTTQVLTAFEYDKAIFETKISSGLALGNVGPDEVPTITPQGKGQVVVKMPSKHMGDGQLVADPEAYELVGVPWCTFFKMDDKKFMGHAFHGTYWHDNFGVPMSHGCVNMRNPDAQWLFRWTTPLAPEFDPLTLDKKGNGTRIEIFD
jgi:hypothetical protein